MTGDLRLMTKLKGNREATMVVTTERRIVLIRWMGIVAGGIAVPFLGLKDLGLMYAVIMFAVVYNTFYQFYFSLPAPPKGIATNPTVLASVDILMTSAAIYATGGIHSDFFVIYFLIVVMSAMRFGGVAGGMVTLLSIVAYVVVVLLAGAGNLVYAGAEVLLRMGFVVATGVFVGYVGDKARQMERDAQAEAAAAQVDLQESSGALYQSLEIRDVLQEAADQALRLGRCDLAVVSPSLQSQDMLPSLLRSDLKPYAATKRRHPGLDRDVAAALVDAFESSPTRRVRATDDMEDAVQVAVLKPGHELAQQIGMADGALLSMAATQLLHGDQQMGKLYCVKFADQDWAQTVMDVLEVYADRIAVAMTNAFVLAQSKTQAITDPVTGMYNHRYFYEFLDRQLTEALRRKQELSVMVIDVDAFKMFNDSYGHLIGDVTLKAVADIIRAVLQSRGMAARFGGDEFAIVLPEVGNAEAVEIGEQIRRRVLDVSNVAIFEPLSALSVSVGVATAADFITPDKLFEKADMALNLAKAEGKNRVRSADGVPLAEALALAHEASLPGPGVNSAIHMINALTAALGARSPAVKQHAFGVSRMAWLVAQALGLPPRHADRIRSAGLLHDIGLLGLPDEVLAEHGQLSLEEQQLWRTHPEVGERLVASVPLLEDFSAAVRHHHEWFDGSGYPDRLHSSQIPLEARIIALCDVFEMLTAPGSEGPGLGVDAALQRISERVGTQFDPEIWPAFSSTVRDRQASRA